MNIKQKYRNAEISTKITITYTACFILLLMIINTVMYFGFFHVLYRPANRVLKYSMQNFQNLIAESARDIVELDPVSIRKPLFAGVVLRIADESGKILVDTNAQYPSNELFNINITKDHSFFVEDDMEVATINGALIYRAAMEYTFNDNRRTLYFFRTITSQKFLIEDLENALLTLDLVGIILAVAIGNFVSRKILKPIKIMTEHAQKIAFGTMSGRIEINPAKDELTELAKTFNDMLDRIQDGINKQQEFLLCIQESIDKQQQFVLDASHALINPATAIRGNTDLLKAYGFDDKKIFEECTESISESLKNMELIIQNLLFIAQADQKRKKLTKTDLNLKYLIEYAVEFKKIFATNHEIEIVQNDDAQIFADQYIFLQMLDNFLDNAIKYSPDGGKILVTSKISGENILLSIADNGVGIAQEHFDKIFERFFRIKTVEKVDGGGLGLTVAKWIADNHGIKISLQSKLGEGSTFTLTIPKK